MVEEVKQYFTSFRSPGWEAPVELVPQECEDTEVQPDMVVLVADPSTARFADCGPIRRDVRPPGRAGRAGTA